MTASNARDRDRRGAAERFRRPADKADRQALTGESSMGYCSSTHLLQHVSLLMPVNVFVLCLREASLRPFAQCCCPQTSPNLREPDKETHKRRIRLVSNSNSSLDLVLQMSGCRNVVTFRSSLQACRVVNIVVSSEAETPSSIENGSGGYSCTFPVSSINCTEPRRSSVPGHCHSRLHSLY